MKKLLLTDVDGVLLNWEHGFHEFMVKKGHELTANGFDEYQVERRYKDLDHDLGRRLIWEFNHQPHTLIPLRDSMFWISRLAAEGWRFGVITSHSDQPEAVQSRIDNLIKKFGHHFDFIDCLPTGADKDEALARRAEQGLFWVEDKPANIDAGLKVGLRGLLMDHAHNADYVMPKGTHRVRDWYEIYRILRTADESTGLVG